jgi:hypothetical protein
VTFLRFHCPCGTHGKVRRIRGDLVVFWKREGVWWPDYEALSERNVQGVRCGYCGVPPSTLLEMGVATRVQ